MTLNNGKYILILILLSSCVNSYYRMINELKNMPAADYSYAIDAQFKSSKEELEFKIKELFQAEEVRFSIRTFHGYEKGTYKQINEDFWVRFVLYNSSTINIYNEEELEEEGRKIAKMVINDIENSDCYKKIEITFINKWEKENNTRLISHPEFFSLPGFEKTTMFNE